MREKRNEYGEPDNSLIGRQMHRKRQEIRETGRDR